MVNQSFPEDFLVEHVPGPGQPDLWLCMDDRPPVPGSFALQERIYSQWPGGIHGIALDHAVAMEVQRPRSYLDLGGSAATIEGLTRDLYHILAEKSIQAVLHERCAAELRAYAIGLSVATGDENVFSQARLSNPDLEVEGFLQIAAATKRIIDAQVLTKDMEAAHRRMTDSVPESQPIPSLHLQGDHVASIVLANWRRGVQFDTARAAAAHMPAYQISFGDSIEITTALEPHMQVSPALVRAAMATRVGAIVANHLRAPDDNLLSTQLLEA